MSTKVRDRNRKEFSAPSFTRLIPKDLFVLFVLSMSLKKSRKLSQMAAVPAWKRKQMEAEEERQRNLKSEQERRAALARGEQVETTSEKPVSCKEAERSYHLGGQTKS